PISTLFPYTTLFRSWIGFHRMGISQLPDVDFPIVTVTVTWENASPEIMETQVADPIEGAVTSIEGIRDIYSTSRLGQTDITIELDRKSTRLNSSHLG